MAIISIAAVIAIVYGLIIDTVARGVGQARSVGTPEAAVIAIVAAYRSQTRRSTVNR